MTTLSVISEPARTAIACATGGFKGAFVDGVLNVFEETGYRAGAYASASSSVLPAAAAAVGQSYRLGVDHWLEGQQMMDRPGTNMSAMILDGIARNGPWLKKRLFEDYAARFLIAASAVDETGAEETQGKGARRRGRQLLLSAARGERSWIDDHLTLELFDTASNEMRLRLTGANFDQVAYASSRMLHAWDVPAWIDGRPYVDAFYTCACPALQMAEIGFESVIALSTEPILYRDIFQDSQVPTEWRGATIHIIAPSYDPAEKGVQYTTANPEGLALLYEHGRQQGRAFLAADSMSRS